MSKINWQQPYVNIFKNFTIASDKNVVKYGEITSVIDNQIKTSIYKILGPSSFINFPKLSGQSLNLTGRYIYFLFKPLPNKFFSIHIDLATNEKISLRISFSNSFKEFKATSTWLQFPYVILSPKGSVFEQTEQKAKNLTGSAPPITKWTILCIDLINIAQSYSNKTYQSVRSLKLCANMLVKNVVTSDYLYEPGINYAEARLRNRNGTAFPRELSYPCEKYDDWHQLYDYICFPGESFKKPFDSVGQSRIMTGLIENDIPLNQQIDVKRAQIKDVNLTKSNNKTTSSSFIDSVIQKNTNNNEKQIVTCLPLVGVQNDEDLEKNLKNTQSKLNLCEENELFQQDIHVYPCKIKSSANSSLSSISNFEEENNIIESTNQKENFEMHLEPDPILRLKKIIGFGSRTMSTNSSNDNIRSSENNFKNCIRWSSDSKFLVYACQANVVSYNINDKTQSCFVGHSDRVSCLSISSDNSLLATGQSGQYSLVRLWNFQTKKCLSIFRNHDHSLYLLEFSNCGNYLCGVGKDKQGKSLLIIWDVRNIKMNNLNKTESYAKVIAKAHSDVHINRIMFFHFDSTRLISCGRNNVRFWRLKNDTLRSCSVNLLPYINYLKINNESDENVCLEFTDICANSRIDNNDNLVYSCTKAGQIFILNLAKMDIENVRVLEPIINKKESIESDNKKHQKIKLATRLNSLSISDNYCVTGSEDGVVRIWPLDFSLVLVEAEHESSIELVIYSCDCSKIATATVTSLGILDINTKEYSTLVRSHVDIINDISIDLNNKFIATCSKDSTIKVWSLDCCKQLYEFIVPNEKPTRLCFSNSKNSDNIFACGFSSGKVRLFDVIEFKIIKEIRAPHIETTNQESNSAVNMLNFLNMSKYEITDLMFTNNGKRLITSDAMKCLCLYETERDYSLLRILPNSISCFGSLCICPDDKKLAIIGPSDFLISVFDSLTLNEVIRINIMTNSSTNDLNDINTNLCSKQEAASKITFSSTSQNQILCVTSSNKLLKFDSKNGRLLSSLEKLHRSRTDFLTASNEGKYLISTGDNCIKIWDYNMRFDKNFQTFIAHSSAVKKIILSSDNKTLISIGDSILFWDFLAYFPIEEKHSQNSKLEDKKIKISENNIFEDKVKIFNKDDFKNVSKKEIISLVNEKKKFSNYNLNWSTISQENPRIPPVAATNIHIETITANIQADEIFSNDELSIDEEFDYNNSKNKPFNKFQNLPELILDNDEQKNFFFDILNSPKQTRENIQKIDAFQNFDKNSLINEKLPETISKDISLPDFIKPKNSKHLITRKKESIQAKKRYTAPEKKCGLKLNSVIGFNGKYASKNLIWNKEFEFFAYSIGSIISIEELKTGKQKLLYSHYEDITALCLKNDNSQMASASSYIFNLSISNKTDLINHNEIPKCQIVIWSCSNFNKVVNLFHKNAFNITCMSFSADDNYLVSASDYFNPSLTIWNTSDYSVLVEIQNCNYVINEISWSLNKSNEFMICGQNKVLVICHLDLYAFEDRQKKCASLSFNEIEIPLILLQEHDNFDFTSLNYCENNLFFAATNFGTVTVWNAKTNSCLLNWKADTNEIDVLISNKNRLITGSSKGNLKLWNITNIIDNKLSLKSDSLIIEKEILLNGAIKCCQFDTNLELGLVATNKGAIWYINWQEESSVRLISSHTSKINSALCIEDKYLSTISDDGSLNIWSLSDRERIVQFEVKIPALCQCLILNQNHKDKKPKYKNNSIMVGYRDGYIRVFDINSKNIVKKLYVTDHNITVIHFLEKTSTVLVGTNEGLIYVFDLEDDMVKRIINDHKGSITNIDSFFKESKKTTYWLASSIDGNLSVWKFLWLENIYQLIDWLSFPKLELDEEKKKIKKYPLNLAYFEPESHETLIYVGYGLNKKIFFYNFIQKVILKAIDITEYCECIALSPKQNLIALGTNTRLLQIRDYNQSTFQDYSQHSDTVSCITFCQNGKKLITTSFNEIFIWDINV